MHIIYICYDEEEYQDCCYYLADHELKRVVTIDDFSSLIDDIRSNCQNGKLNLFLLKQDSGENAFSTILRSLNENGVTPFSESIDLNGIKEEILTQFDGLNGLDRIRRSIENSDHSVLSVSCQCETDSTDGTDVHSVIETYPDDPDGKGVDLPKGSSMLYRIIANKYGVYK